MLLPVLSIKQRELCMKGRKGLLKDLFCGRYDDINSNAGKIEHFLRLQFDSFRSSKSYDDMYISIAEVRGKERPIGQLVFEIISIDDDLEDFLNHVINNNRGYDCAEMTFYKYEVAEVYKQWIR